MVKSLCDICLSVVQVSLDKVPSIGLYLPTVYKEMLLERLAWHDLFTPDYLPHISQHLMTQSVRRVNFYRCEQITDNVLHLVQASGCKLIDLTIQSCQYITDKGFKSVTLHQDCLEHLKFKKLKGLTNGGLQFVCSEKLVRVDLKDCTNVTFEGARQLVERNKSIRELHLAGIDEAYGERSNSARLTEQFNRKHAELIKIAECLKLNLEELDTQLDQINDDCLVALASHCPNLKRLNLHGSSRVTGEAITKFSMGCHQLESLDLSYCNSLCLAPCSQALWTLPQALTELSLCGVLLGDETIFVECFQRLKNLKCARLCGVLALNDNTLRQILQHIGLSLTSLDLSGSAMGRLTDAGLSSVAELCMNLEVLAISLLSGFTCDGLMPLFSDPQRASKFKKLFISVRGINKEIVQEAIRSCHNLEKIDLSGLTFIADEHLVALAENCPRLSEIGIKGCREVTDHGVCSLARSCPLRSLVLSGIHSLTDRTVFVLANSCHYLEEIYISGCANISTSAVRYLIDCTIPRLFVKHATPNAAPDQLMARNLDTGEFCRADLMNKHYFTAS